MHITMEQQRSNSQASFTNVPSFDTLGGAFALPASTIQMHIVKNGFLQTDSLGSLAPGEVLIRF